MVESGSAEPLYAIFNSQLEELLQQLVSLFPDMRNLKELGLMLGVTKSLNFKLPLDTFKAAVLTPYDQELRSHDEAFFIKQLDYEDVITSAASSRAASSSMPSSAVTSSIHSLIDALKDVWQRQLDDESRSNIWRYIDNLVTICDRVPKSP